MEKEELLRMKGYWRILEEGNGRLSLLSPYEQKDLKQLLQKWLKENYGEEKTINAVG